MVNKIRSKPLANILRLASALALGIAIGFEAAIGVYGLPYPTKGEEWEKEKQRKIGSSKPQHDADEVSSKERKKEVRIEVEIEKPSNSLLPAPSSIVAQHGSYVSAYDKRLRNPAWACIHLDRRSYGSISEAALEKADRSLSKFKPDKTVPEQFRTRPEDFKSSGYDRGHLIAASDVSTQEDMDETFLMSNISPQVGVGMNRGFWQLLERFVRNLTMTYDDVFVCSGPLFLPEFDQATQTWMVKYPLIGPKHDIAVPTHFFKCIHAKTGDKQSQTCFIVPNRQIDHTREPLSKFEASVEEVERAAGFEIFPGAKSKAPSSVCDEIKCDLLKEQIFRPPKQ